MNIEKRIEGHLIFVYGAEKTPQILKQIQTRLKAFTQQHPGLSIPVSVNQRITEADAILITYGDQIVEPDKPTLRTLAEVAAQHLTDAISTIHLLPFYPYSSDDGFSVIDYKAINPGWGDWHDVALIGQNFRLMFDAVINHISVQSEWFQGFLQGDSKYANYFITVDPGLDLSAVTRPRTLPLLTPFDTPNGPQHVWTTFGPDQVDINYESPDLLLEIIDVLLFYVAQGAEFIRLDAIAFMWKEVGTTCIHLPQTHHIIQLFRAVLDLVAPNVMLITETNVPHQENISYFGDGRNEAQMVYQFSLAPLILHTFHTGDATKLQQWAVGLEELPNTATFFNFIASHDGIGLRPAEGILTPAEIQHLADTTQAHGGYVSYKTNPDGSRSAYELNVTLFDALSNPNSDEDEQVQIDRFMTSQAIMLTMVGVPGIYVHSLFGSANDYIGVEETGRTRSINRQKWLRAEIEAVLANPKARANKIFQRYVSFLKIRAAHSAFHPNGQQQIIKASSATFVILRTSPDETEQMLCVHNITDQAQVITLDMTELLILGNLKDVLGGEMVQVTGQPLHLSLAPYQTRWLLG